MYEKAAKLNAIVSSVSLDVRQVHIKAQAYYTINFINRLIARESSMLLLKMIIILE